MKRILGEGILIDIEGRLIQNVNVVPNVQQNIDDRDILRHVRTRPVTMNLELASNSRHGNTENN
jgi:hypothetical protein